MRVLLVVDLLNDFCPGGALAVPEGDRIVPVINRLMVEGGFDLKIAVNDLHPADHLGFVTSHEGKQLFDIIDLHGLKQKLWPAHCVENTTGAMFHPAFESHRLDATFYKGTDRNIDSNSGFFDNGKRSETGVRQYLEEQARIRGVKYPSGIEIVCVGLAFEICVADTAVHAADLGYRTSIALDATRALNLAPDDDIKRIRELIARENPVEIIDSRQILAAAELRLQARRREVHMTP